MSKESSHIKIGNTSFNKKEAMKMTFKQFSSVYKDILKGVSLEEAYIAIGGKVKNKEDNGV